ncbi:MAG: RloB domain-containing protein [Planctomycetia bacterium]|nr:RloB domain-containing protein [Planctomycetia bacterium]
MKRKRKYRTESIIFGFGVEGQCEKLYLEHLQKLINDCKDKKYPVQFKIRVHKKPAILDQLLCTDSDVQLFYLWDREGNSSSDNTCFCTVCKELEKFKNYNIMPGYVNLTFELWLLLHLVDGQGYISTKDAYLDYINTFFSTNFENLDDYKKEPNFKKILDKIELKHVAEAVHRGNRIRNAHRERGDKHTQVLGYKCYHTNPDLLLHECISKIFNMCGLDLKVFNRISCNTPMS